MGHVSDGRGSSRGKERRGLGGHLRRQLAENLRLAGQGPIPGAEHDGLSVLELRSDISLGSGEGLLADIAGRNHGALGVGNLEVVAEDTVVADPEAANAGALPLRRLQSGDEVTGLAGRAVQGIELGIGAGAHEAPLAGARGRSVDEHGGEAFTDLRGRGHVVGEAAQLAGKAVDENGEGGQGPATVTDGAEVAGGGQPLGGSPDEPLEVADLLQAAAQLFAAGPVGGQGGDGREPRGDRLGIEKRLLEAATQEAGAHARPGPIEEPGEARPTPQRHDELEVASRRGVENHRLPHPAGGDLEKAGLQRDAGPLAVGEDRPGGGQGSSHSLDPEPGEGDRPGRRLEPLGGAAGVEEARGEPGAAGRGGGALGQGCALGEE